MKRAEKLLRISVRPRYLAALLRHRVAAAVEHEGLLRRLECRTVLDVGAHTGQFALVAGRCFPGAALTCVEPLPGPAGRLRRLLKDEQRVSIHGVAIGSTQGTQIMHVAGHDDSSSLLPITGLQSSLFPGTHEVTTDEVTVCRLSDVVAPDDIVFPALLKVDVQGYELEVLRGSEALLPRFRWLYVECSFVELYQGQPLADEVIAWLLQRGFRLKGVHNTVRDKRGAALQADLLFGRESTDA